MQPFVSALAVAVTVAPIQVAAAQTGPRFECPACRAIAHFRTCHHPADGSTAFAGTVIDVQKRKCSEVLSIGVKRASEMGLPTTVKVDLGYCAFWAGQTGDVIDVAISSPARTDDVYALACNHWKFD